MARSCPHAAGLTLRPCPLSWLERMAFYYATAGASDTSIVIVGMPLDRTSSFVPGARFGPDIIRMAADNIESFSPYQNHDISGIKIHDAGNLEFMYPTATAPMELIAATTGRNLARGVTQLALGGEHTITAPIVTELTKNFPDLCVVQYDAHSDLRQEFLGERICHATAMTRVLDSIPRERLFQLFLPGHRDVRAEHVSVRRARAGQAGTFSHRWSPGVHNAGHGRT